MLNRLACLLVVIFLNVTLLPVSARADILGTNGNDSLTGTSGNDLIVTGLGNDNVDGGAGTDTVRLPLFPNTYQFAKTGTYQYTVRYQDYTTYLYNVEYVEFGSSSVTKLPIANLLSGNVQTQLARLTDLYLAFFGRAPDVTGLEYWQKRHLEEGRNTTVISMDFSWSDEAKALFPLGSNNRDFVKTVYQNCFGRDPDAGGWDYWTNKLNALNPASPTYLNDRGAFVGELLLGAYAPTSGDADRNLLTNRHEVAMYYVNKLSMQPGEGFDNAIDDLLKMVNVNNGTRFNGMNVIDHVFANPATLTGVMGNQTLMNSVWMHDAKYDVDNDGDGLSEIQGDCNDNVTTICPGSLDICGDGIDQDCSGADQLCPNDIDSDSDGFTENQGDCNDSNSGIRPGATDICGDGIDQDCSGADLICAGACNTSPTFADIAGTWDMSEDYGAEGYDVIYVAIRSDGSFTVYDYAGDTFDNEGNCYWIWSENLVSLGNGNFRDADGYTMKLKLCGNQLIETSDGVYTYNRTNKSYFTPVCN